MSRYNSYEEKRPVTDNKIYIHPIWRGIGFALLIFAPIMGYASSILLLDLNKENKWIPVPKDLLISGSDPYLIIKIIITIVVAFIIFLLFQLITFFLYKVAGPSRYGPLDVPRVAYRGKKYKR
ncbi:MAG: hypothetical protein CVU40_02745 [Chloroflexi bacterium HGW-Chloroflexi-2]|jgi:hypothetical protein|nr:MAG: hypothetical protein CVU40_02745 [Chloroflexi bacterium HGW-Chloroflexi-2]